MTDKELNALRKRAERLSKSASVFCSPTGHTGELVRQAKLTVAMLTTLRAQLAEEMAERDIVNACNRGLARLNEATQARAAQPHDRTALDRMLIEAREKALREAVQAVAFYPVFAAEAILALIEKRG